MGNTVQAATAPSPPPMGFQQPPPPASEPKENALGTPAESPPLEYPGTMEDLHKRCKGMTVGIFFSFRKFSCISDKTRDFINEKSF